MFLSAADKVAIRDSWRLAVPIKATVADLFYRRLFELKPEYRKLFHSDMRAQHAKLVGMLAFIVGAVDWADEDWELEVERESDLFLVTLALGRRHTELYKIPEESYAVIGEVLIYTLDYGLGRAFTPLVKEAWTKMYDILIITMRMGESAVSMGAPMETSVAREL